MNVQKVCDSGVCQNTNIMTSRCKILSYYKNHLIKLYNIKFPLCHLRIQCFDLLLVPAIFKVHLSCLFKNPFL